jgi:hypothetical protein
MVAPPVCLGVGRSTPSPARDPRSGVDPRRTVRIGRPPAASRPPPAQRDDDGSRTRRDRLAERGSGGSADRCRTDVGPHGVRLCSRRGREGSPAGALPGESREELPRPFRSRSRAGLPRGRRLLQGEGSPHERGRAGSDVGARSAHGAGARPGPVGGRGGGPRADGLCAHGPCSTGWPNAPCQQWVVPASGQHRSCPPRASGRARLGPAWSCRPGLPYAFCPTYRRPRRRAHIRRAKAPSQCAVPAMLAGRFGHL